MIRAFAGYGQRSKLRHLRRVAKKHALHCDARCKCCPSCTCLRWLRKCSVSSYIPMYVSASRVAAPACRHTHPTRDRQHDLPARRHSAPQISQTVVGQVQRRASRQAICRVSSLLHRHRCCRSQADWACPSKHSVDNWHWRLFHRPKCVSSGSKVRETVGSSGESLREALQRQHVDMTQIDSCIKNARSRLVESRLLSSTVPSQEQSLRCLRWKLQWE